MKLALRHQFLISTPGGGREPEEAGAILTEGAR